ncbi:MAG: hypothetical protein RIR70_169 [Pseudomonadota bacterium]
METGHPKEYMEALKALGQTSTHWRDMKRAFATSITLPASEVAHLDPSRYPKLSEIKLTGRVSSETLGKFVEQWVSAGQNSLTKLDLSKCDGVTDAGLAHLPRSCTVVTQT